MGKKNKLLKVGLAAGAVYAVSGAAFTGFVLTRAHKQFSKFADWVKGTEPAPPADTFKTQAKSDHIVIKNRDNKSSSVQHHWGNHCHRPRRRRCRSYRRLKAMQTNWF